MDLFSVGSKMWVSGISLFSFLVFGRFCDAATWRSAPGRQTGITHKGAVFYDVPRFPQQDTPLVRAVSVACGESQIVVQVRRDLFGTGQLINSSDVSLGGCAATRQDDAAQVLIFESELQACRSSLTSAPEELVYNFSLNYTPRAIANTPIVRTNGAVVGIECRYMRFHNVSSSALKPTWVPYTSTKSAEDVLDFSLVLMADDWSSPRTSNVFYLGDVLNIEASVSQADHQPLRLFVDSCVATLVPDQTSTPRYAFIENHGCLTDAKTTGSSSQFMPRPQDGKLRMKLDAFRFYQDARSSIYITCLLKVTAASQSVDSLNKACYATGNVWTSVDGSDQVCSCCDSSCPTTKSRHWMRMKRDLGSKEVAAAEWEGDATVGPLFVLGEQAVDRPAEVKGQRSLLRAQEEGDATGVSAEPVILAALGAVVGLVCVAVLGTVLYRRLQSKSTELTVEK
ncbi:zona pellucida sperm-binding protein 3-like [Lepisosteus oculatus]|uniref:zona pellucida sperm-binding protein 3-like n=1 Tax=Lepisosteus oculatus TaxID=7918 RepID=UPI0037106B3B